MEDKKDILENPGKKGTPKPVNSENTEDIMQKKETGAKDQLSIEPVKASPKVKPKKNGKKAKDDKKTKRVMPNAPLCKLVKKDFLKDHIKEYKALVQEPEYVCKKCGRLAKSKRSLCKPVRLD